MTISIKNSGRLAVLVIIAGLWLATMASVLHGCTEATYIPDLPTRLVGIWEGETSIGFNYKYYYRMELFNNRTMVIGVSEQDREHFTDLGAGSYTITNPGNVNEQTGTASGNITYTGVWDGEYEFSISNNFQQLVLTPSPKPLSPANAIDYFTRIEP